MKKLWFAFIFLCFSSSAWGITGLGIGIRGGMIQNYSYDKLDVIPTQNKDWLKEMPVVGVHLKIGTLRIIQLEGSLEYAWKKKQIVVDPDIKTDFSINDLSFNATAKYMLSFPVIKPYVGAGVGIHRLAYGISNHSYTVYIPEVQSQMGWHGVGGLVLSPPAVPLEFFVEARYTHIPTKEKVTHYTTILAGVTYNLP
ncbi:MAG TPA: outer membrane beta-barrel protein [candidate division Zixibacteria bacterium]